MRYQQIGGPFISKSKYLAGLQCPKLLWYYYNAKDEIPPVDAAIQAIFDQGHLVGELAKELFPGGIEVAKDIFQIPDVVKQSSEAVKHQKTLYEAGFSYKNAYARADILNPVGKDKWDIIEVKSSTEVKDENLDDLAIQKCTYEGAGLSIRHCNILHINTEYTRKGKIDPQKLFTLVDVTREANELLPKVEDNLKSMVDVIKQKKFPDIPIGLHCDSPYACPLQEMCWDFLPEDNVFTLYRLGQKGFELLSQGIEGISDIPDDFVLSEKQQIQKESLRTGEPYIDKSGINSFLQSLEYPLYFLDFETFMTAIPLYDNLRPYQQVPFQYSLHVVESNHSKSVHTGFLSDGKVDPRPEILARLKKELGKSGSIVAYNAAFEKSRLKESTATYQEYTGWFEKIEQRIVDLLAPFRSFYYYHPKQKGSASLKAVLPMLTGKGYEGMDITEGGTASLEYLRVTFGDVAESERNKVRKQLEEYCSMDTEVMWKIIEQLRKLSST